MGSAGYTGGPPLSKEKLNQERREEGTGKNEDGRWKREVVSRSKLKITESKRRIT